MQPNATAYTAFSGTRQLASGTLDDVSQAVRTLPQGTAHIFEDATGRLIDSFESAASAQPSPEPARGRGRPKLGVVPREVTLLPRHWEWLNAQPGGASVALRKLVEQARRVSGDKDRRRAANEATYRFLSAVAGDLPGYEEALRALFDADADRRDFAQQIANWPKDVRDYAVKLAFRDADHHQQSQQEGEPHHVEPGQ